MDIPEILFAKDLLDPDTDEGGNIQMRRRKTRLTNSSCPICLEFFEEKIKIKLLPCEHGFHSECLGPWLADSDSWPICRQSVLDKLVNNEAQDRCCCRLWRVPSEQELRQQLLVSESETDEPDIEDVENFDEEKQSSLSQQDDDLRNQDTSLRHVPVLDAEMLEDHQPSLIADYRLASDQGDQVDVMAESKQNDED